MPEKLTVCLQIREAWHWPTFGYCFFEFDSHRDAEDAMKQLQGSKTAEGKQLTLYYTYVMFFIHYTVAEIAYLTFCLILNNEPAFTGIYVSHL